MNRKQWADDYRRVRSMRQRGQSIDLSALMLVAPEAWTARKPVRDPLATPCNGVYSRVSGRALDPMMGYCLRVHL